MLELYHAEPGANSLKCLLYFKEKKLDFVSHYVDLLRFEQHSPEFVAINPNGQVPVLIHDGAIITESTVINEYLEDVFPENPLRPENLVERARMRFWTKYCDEYFNPALSMIGWHIMVRKVVHGLEKDKLEEILERIPLREQRQKWATVAGESFTEEQLADSKERIIISINRIDQELAEKPWLAGGSYSLADIAAYPLVFRLPHFYPEVMNEENTPHAMDWLRRMDARPGTQEALAMPNKVPESVRTFTD